MRQLVGDGSGTQVNAPPFYADWAQTSLAQAIVSAEWSPPVGSLTQELAERVAAPKRHASSAVLFAALAVEGFLNFVGLRSFGGVAYEQFERCSTTKKTAWLIELTSQRQLAAGNAVLQHTGALAKLRSELGHPKSSVITPPGTREAIEIAQSAVAHMQAFFVEFAALAPQMSDEAWRWSGTLADDEAVPTPQQPPTRLNPNSGP